MNMKALAVTAVLAAGAMAGAAHANTYDFGYATTSGPFEFGTGSFTTNAAGQITSVGSGIAETDGLFTSIVSGAPSSYAGADNQFSDSSTYFDMAGFSFATASGVDVNLFSSAPDTYGALDSAINPAGNPFTGPSSTITLNVTEIASAVPEPSMWALMIAGVGMIGGMLRLGRRQGWALGGATA